MSSDDTEIESVFTEPEEERVPVLLAIPNGVVADEGIMMVQSIYAVPMTVVAAIQATLDEYRVG